MSSVKIRLQNYKEVKASMYEYKIQIEELEEDICCGGVSYEFKGGHTNKISSSTEDIAIKLASKKEELEKLFKISSREIERIDNALNMLKVKERQAIELRFIEEDAMSTVCYKLDRSMTTTKRFIRDGLEKMEKLLEN